jgi:mycothiol synthase
VRTELRDRHGLLVQLEADPATEDDDSMADAAGLALTRAVLQLRVPLPLAEPVPAIATSAFRPGIDDDAFLSVNNRAFEWHPDQAGWTSDHLRERMAEPWFDPAGFLLHERDGVLAGFCWTKIHPPTSTDPELGEIYVIAVDPAFHGLGLGRALTLAGLDHLASVGVRTGMLHVEHDNIIALGLYLKIGFVEHDTHRWWAAPGADRPTATTP